MSEPRTPTEVGLDDLFATPRGVPPLPVVRVPSPAGRWLLGRAFFAVALGAVLYGLLYLVRLTAPYPLLVVTIFVITVLKYALGRIAARPLPRQLTGRGIRPGDPGSGAGWPGPHRDGLDLAVGRWTEALHRGSRDSGWHADVVLPRLGELVDERLRLRHGFTRASDPPRAREMMGEHLWRMLHDPSAGGTPRDMARMVTRIEEL